MGIERLLLLVREYGRLKTEAAPDIYLMQQEEGQAAAMRCAALLRAAGFNVLQHSGAQSLKNQMKKADASGARFAVIVGASEAEQGAATLKDMQGGHGQQTIAAAALPELINQWKNA
jgi:histidine--tRNA ligase